MSKKRVTLRRQLFRLDEYEVGDPVKLVNQINEALASIPEEYRSRAVIEIEKEPDYYDVVNVYLEMYYYSPETDEEYAQRKQAEADRTAGLRMRELQLLQQLKAKYEQDS